MDDYIYKYKSGSLQNIIDLLSNQLWISTIEKMNDPDDPFFYIENCSSQTLSFYRENIISQFDKILVSAFSNTYANKHLWNYYTNILT